MKSVFKVRSLLFLTVVVLFSTTLLLSSHTRANIATLPSSPNRGSAPMFSALPVPTLESNSTDHDLQERLTAHALAYLKAEHDIELTGQRPTRQLITRYDGERHRERTAEDRISSGLRLHEHYQRSVRRLRYIDVMLTPSGVRVMGDKVLLQATEHTTYHYSVSTGVRLPDTSEDRIDHVFVFSRRSPKSMENETAKPALIPVGYSAKNAKTTQPAAALPQALLECDPAVMCLIYDSTGCDPYGYYPCEDPSFDDSTYCCYAEEAAYNQPIGAQSLNPDNVSTGERANAGCDYRGFSAASYAYNWALGHNPSYRVYENDCTNFVSQALREGGGWRFKQFRQAHKNWGLWWYDPSGSQNKGQTRSWTQSRALEYFIWNSGRGYNTTSFCDLAYGDVLVVDWENDGDIDHAMIVTNNVNCLLGADSLLLSQHSPGRRDKSLRQYLTDVPTAKFHAWWICHTGF